MKTIVKIGTDDEGMEIYVNPTHVVGLVGDENNFRTIVRMMDDVVFSIDRAPFDVARSINDEI